MTTLSKKLKYSFLSLILTNLLFSTNVLAATATGDAAATILEPLAVSQSQSLDFGSLVSSGSSTTATTSGTSGTAQRLGSSSYSDGSFNVTGSDNNSYNITIDSNVTLNSGSDNMTASLEVDNTSSNTSTQSLSSGSDTFNVRGTLTLAADQAEGDYSGTYDVTVAYE